MSATTTFDSSTIEELRKQTPQSPWNKRTGSFKRVVALAVILPALVIGALFLLTDIQGPVIMIGIYLPLQIIAAVFAAISQRGAKAAADAVIIVCAIGATLFSFIILLSLLWSIVSKGMEAMSLAFLFQNNEYISPSTPLGWGGVGHAVLGTVLIVAIATLISMPIGVATALYITEVRGKAVPYVRFFVQAMSGVPSVVAGLFILTVFILTGVFQQSALTGGLAYAILMLPTVARTAEEVLRLIPDDLRTGALALGSTRARVVLKVVIPAAKTGLITAMILGIARVVGETAPLLMTALKNDKTVLNPIMEPITALPVYIFSNVAQPYPAAVARAWGAALVLMILVAILFTVTRILTSKKTGR